MRKEKKEEKKSKENASLTDGPGLRAQYVHRRHLDPSLLPRLPGHRLLDALALRVVDDVALTGFGVLDVGKMLSSQEASSLQVTQSHLLLWVGARYGDSRRLHAEQTLCCWTAAAAAHAASRKAA
jgi:hypothetical protein